MKKFSTPILFIIFNRYNETSLVFEKIREIKPVKLFISADGPRKNIIGDIEKCQKTRKIVEKIDWECKVFTKFNKENLGCKNSVSSAITWFFENVEEGIILEDDCVPSESFFSFCQELLIYYRYDYRVMHIGGTNFQFGNKRGNESYYFSKCIHIWGWATWKRAWKFYDKDIKSFPSFFNRNLIKNIYSSKKIRKYYIKIFENVYNRKIDTWDYQWLYTVISQNGLGIIPNENLITNIGFGENATHTIDSDNIFSIMERKDIYDIIHPEFILINKEADDFTYKMLLKVNLIKRIRNKLKKLF